MITIGTIHATIPLLGPYHFITSRALPKELARIRRHGFGNFMSAVGTGNGGFQRNRAHFLSDLSVKYPAESAVFN